MPRSKSVSLIAGIVAPPAGAALCVAAWFAATLGAAVGGTFVADGAELVAVTCTTATTCGCCPSTGGCASVLLGDVSLAVLLTVMLAGAIPRLAATPVPA